MKEIINKVKLVYSDPQILEKKLSEKISNNSYSRWCDLIEKLKSNTGLNVINTSLASLPCHSCKIVIEAIKGNVFIERSIVLKESIVNPYLSLHGLFGCIESPHKDKIWHKKSLILGDIGEYGKYMKIVKETLSNTLEYEPVFVDVEATVNAVVKLDNELNYVGNQSTLYNQLFGDLAFATYHVIS